MARLPRIERGTYGLEGRCSVLLSYRRKAMTRLTRHCEPDRKTRIESRYGSRAGLISASYKIDKEWTLCKKCSRTLMRFWIYLGEGRQWMGVGAIVSLVIICFLIWFLTGGQAGTPVFLTCHCLSRRFQFRRSRFDQRVDGLQVIRFDRPARAADDLVHLAGAASANYSGGYVRAPKRPGYG